MKKLVCLVTISVLLHACDSVSEHSDADFVIQNARFFDGDTVHPESTIVIGNGIVQKIYRDRSTAFSGDNVIDGKGSTVVPGLINAHVHLKNFDQAAEAVQDGVLTLINMGGLDFPFQDSMRQRGDAEVHLPYFISAGNMVTVPDGHGTQYVPYETVSSAAELPDFIGRRVEEGSDFIKLTIERGDLNLQRPTLSDDMIAATITAAKEHGLMAVAHISERNDAINAADMGVDGLVHFWVKNFSDDFPDVDVPGITPGELDFLHSSSVFIIPTIVIWEKVNNEWQTVDMAAMKAEVGKVHKAGIPLLAGTDPPGYGVNYGSDLYAEILYLKECGLTDLEALKTATSNVSRAFRLDSKGFVKEGHSADLLLVEGDPTEDVSAIRNIAGIWKQGARIK